MKIKICNVMVEIKYSLLILILVCILSLEFRKYMNYYFECYLFIVFHEFTHIFVASLFNCKLNKLELNICGINANINITKDRIKNIIIYLAGPISNIILAFIFFNNHFIFKINIILGIINLIPIFPLDGYRILLEIGIKQNIFQYVIYVLIFIIGIIFKNINIVVFVIYIFLLNLNAINRQISL